MPLHVLFPIPAECGPLPQKSLPPISRLTLLMFALLSLPSASEVVVTTTGSSRSSSHICGLREQPCRNNSQPWCTHPSGSGGLTSHTVICDNEENRAKKVKSGLELDSDWKADSIPQAAENKGQRIVITHMCTALESLWPQTLSHSTLAQPHKVSILIFPTSHRRKLRPNELKTTCPRSHSQEVAASGLEPQSI